HRQEARGVVPRQRRTRHRPVRAAAVALHRPTGRVGRGRRPPAQLPGAARLPPRDVLRWPRDQRGRRGAVPRRESGGRRGRERLQSCRLYCYHLPPETFACIDAWAGYFVSRDPVVPARVEVIGDPMTELLKRGVELRFVPDLWPLRDAIVASTLQYSMIRMRN